MRLLCLVLAAILAALAGCSSQDPTADSPPVSDPTGSLRLLALGDSYTIGEGVDPSERWPVLVADRLREGGLDVADPEIVARTGWTTAELDRGIDEADLQGSFDVVTLLVGVNNQYRRGSLDTYRSEFRDLLDRAIAFAGGVPDRVVVVSIPDWGVTPFGERQARPPAQIAAEIDAFNAVAREETARAGGRWADITPLSRTQGDQTVADGLHPNGDAYAAWADLITPAVRAALEV